MVGWHYNIQKYRERYSYIRHFNIHIEASHMHGYSIYMYTGAQVYSQKNFDFILNPPVMYYTDLLLHLDISMHGWF